MTSFNRSILYYTFFICIFSTSCGGGGVINLANPPADDSGGFIGDGTTGELADIYSNELPGTMTSYIESTKYDAMVEVGSGLSVSDNLSASGKYELKSTIVFGN